MGLEKHPVLVSVLVSKKLSGFGLGLDYNTATSKSLRPFGAQKSSFEKYPNVKKLLASVPSIEPDFSYES